MIVKQFGGYAIEKHIKGQKWPLYIQYIKGDKIAYTLDHTQARIYKSLKTAQKHDKKIPEFLEI